MDGFQKRREQKKVNILEGALDLFMEFGIQKVSIAEIAKQANVSQVTIYNYFKSKHNLVREVFIYYINKVSDEFEQLMRSDIPFPDKVKTIIFNKKEAASSIHEELYQYFMKEYKQDVNYIEQIYVQRIFPHIVQLLDEGKEQGYVDPTLSTEAVMFYFQMMKEYMQREDIYTKVLPLTEDITKILFYGISGKGEQ
ncbi:TetR/AcrR family transcriptional regulator [Bacillus sp. FJAT-45066]|uniref:TetR/AcrR family transcriptional regulator n=1 Tax=Bacillus sp. FJAT-45066 TaxID=2011010 RepID=UPI000BB9402B|nr:TetR/AcrR family transcriptional regulator [Bacillus sp. FJAT-45066]